jgi:TonB family protein
VRCAGCELEPKKPARYCECCGKEISQHQAKAPETIDTDWAPKRSAWDLRCPKCGGPSLDGGVCQVCQRPTPPADHAEFSSTANHAGAPAAVPSQAPPEAPRASMTPRPPMTPPGPHGITAAPTPAPQRVMPPQHFSELQTIPLAKERTATPPPRRSQIDAATPDRSHRPTVASTRRVQSKQPNRAYSFGLIAASVAVVAALGAAADWLFVHQGAEVTRTAQASMPAVTEQPATQASQPQADVTPAAADRSTPREAVAAEAVAPPPQPVRAPAPAPVAAKDPVPARPKPVTPAKPAARAAAPAAKPAKPQSSPREAGPAPAPVLTASATPAPAPAPVREPAPAASSVEKAAAVGPFFETKDVSETPRITARIEPRLPADLRAKKVHEIVIVRALVSQSGHPSRVTVLRKSKTGPQLDDVVVAAVNQWTFAPAKKKGEPVSCWFNFGVTVGAAD